MADVNGTHSSRNQWHREGDATQSRGPAPSLEKWTTVYEGLTAEEVEAIDRELKTRANLARDVP